MRLAGVVIVNGEGDLLLIHRNSPLRKQWELPGGKIEPGESASAAAAREAREELTCEVTVTQMLGKAVFVEDEHQMEYVWFAADVVSGTPTLGEPDLFDELRYWSLAELRENIKHLSPNACNLVCAILAGTVALTWT